MSVYLPTTIKPICWYAEGFNETLVKYKTEDNILFNIWLNEYNGKHSTKLIALDKTNINLLNTNYNAFEIIIKEQPAKIFLDIDKCNMSYDEITILANEFIAYLRRVYFVEGLIKFVIHISTAEPSINYNTYTDFITSFHIIFNVYCLNNLIIKEIVKQFKSHKHQYNIDLTVYDRNRRFRCINQSKPNKDEILQKICVKNDLVQFTEKSKIFNYNVLAEDLITYIKPETDIFLQIDEPVVDVILPNIHYNIIYSILQLKCAEKYMKNLYEYELVDTHKWVKSLFTLLTMIFLMNNAITIDDEIIEKFLDKSAVGVYKTKEARTNNINFIKNIITDENLYTKIQLFSNKQTISKRLLKNIEIAFILNKLNLPDNTPLHLTHMSISSNDYYVIKIPNSNSIILYNYHKLFLFINCILEKNDKNVVVYFSAQEQYSYTLDNFNTNPLINDKTVKITKLEDIPTKSSQSTYITAPVGSGKSFKNMRKDIISILHTNTNKIVLLTETISLALKQHADFEGILTEVNLPLNILHFYKDKDISITDETRIVVCCYNSLLTIRDTYKKITHVLIDEYVNLTNSFTTNIIEKTVQIELFNYFLGLLRSSIAIKLYDANIHYYDIEFLNKHTNKKIIYYELMGYKQNNHKAVFSSYEIQLELIKTALLNKKQIVIASGEKDKAIEIEQELCKSLNKPRILLISSTGATDNYILNQTLEQKQELKELVLRDTTQWEKYDVVIYTPTVICGISFNIPGVFYAIYGFISSFGANYQQHSQMMYRVRNTITNTLYICCYKNTIKSLPDGVVNSTLPTDTENFTKFFENVMFKTNNKYYITVNNKLVNDLRYTINTPFLYWETINEYITNECKQIKIYKIFENIHYWGTTELVLNYFPSHNLPPPLPTPEPSTQPVYSTAIKDFNEFKTANLLKKIDKKQTEYNIDDIKTFLLTSYGFNWKLYNTLSVIKPSYQTKIYMNDLMGSYTKGLFKKQKLIRFYEVKHIIYFIYEKLLVDIYTERPNINITDFTTQFKKNFSITDYKSYITIITKLYFLFKLLELNAIPYSRFYNFFYSDGNNSQFIELPNKQITDIIKSFIKNNKYVLDYIFNEGGYSHNTEAFINKMCSVINAKYAKKIGTETYYLMPNTSQLIKCRLEQNKYDAIVDYDADDYFYWFNDTSQYFMDIQFIGSLPLGFVKELPKIKMVNMNMDYENNKDINFLLKLFDFYAGQLTDVLANKRAEILNLIDTYEQPYIKITNIPINECYFPLPPMLQPPENISFSSYNGFISVSKCGLVMSDDGLQELYYNEHLTFVYIYDTEFIVPHIIYETFNTPIPENKYVSHKDGNFANNNVDNLILTDTDVDKQIIKDKKTQEAKYAREKKIVCDCGGTYFLYKIDQHNETKQHKTFLENGVKKQDKLIEKENKEKIKEASKNAKKEEKAIQRLEKSNERVKCELCDVFYIRKNKSQHMKIHNK